MYEVGKTIVIEGHDGTGKSTQVDMLAEYLKSEKGITSFTPHEPAGTPIADAIRTIIKDGGLNRSAETNLLLFTAARHEIHIIERRELALGHWVIKARDWSSTVAYQGSGEGLGVGLIREMTERFTSSKYMNPDLKVILSLGHAARKERIENRGTLQAPDTFEQRDEDFQDRVNQAYISIAQREGYSVVDASVSVNEVQAEIIKLLPI